MNFLVGAIGFLIGLFTIMQLVLQLTVILPIIIKNKEWTRPNKGYGYIVGIIINATIVAIAVALTATVLKKYSIAIIIGYFVLPSIIGFIYSGKMQEEFLKTHSLSFFSSLASIKTKKSQSVQRSTKCEVCGSEIPYGEDFCPVCGYEKAVMTKKEADDYDRQNFNKYTFEDITKKLFDLQDLYDCGAISFEIYNPIKNELLKELEKLSNN